jgi:hypothetical protein
MDLELQLARIDKRKQVTYEAPLRSLPDGCFANIEGRAYLVLSDSLLLWTRCPNRRTRTAFCDERARPLSLDSAEVQPRILRDAPVLTSAACLGRLAANRSVGALFIAPCVVLFGGFRRHA